ncbi:deoxyguanosinetriphosphate triphosphohydrolase family protein [Corynebacterium sp. CCM 9204]|uniref:deoxyguanosinetriphosphate triphosphohydrolase family protein n=1 Tax=Corynebacterium sp. CCM 9204 TaxID=3057616 RepID=UPI0035247AAC
MAKPKENKRVFSVSPSVDGCKKKSEESPSSGKESKLSGRKKPGKDGRSEAQRDVDRILYSAAWRRLGGVTQVWTPFGDRPLLHNRLTHSLKVSQIAKGVAEKLLMDKGNRDTLASLGGLDVDVCVAAAMAHDIGHPPFGHIGEKILDDAAREILKLEDGFEGNAQSLRIVSTRRLRKADYQGMDLSVATLAAITKYPWSRAPKRPEGEHEQSLRSDPSYRKHWYKFNFYQSNSHILKDIRSWSPVGDEIQTLEASVMDLADDISYSVHDIEDFIYSGILSPNAVLFEMEKYLELLGLDTTPNTTKEEVKKTLEGVDYPGGIDDRAARDEDVSSLNGIERKTEEVIFRDSGLGKLAKKLSLDYHGWFDPTCFVFGVVSLSRFFEGLTYSYLGERRVPMEADVHSMASNLVERFLKELEVSRIPFWIGGPHVMVGKQAWHEIQILKFITKTYVVDHPDTALLQRGQSHIILELVDLLLKWVKNDFERLPYQLQVWIRESQMVSANGELIGYGRGQFSCGPEKNRAIIDYICTLTDEECMVLYRKLTGQLVHHPFTVAF